jgi:hypothetical protein
LTEVVVAVVAEEIEAEVIRSRLEAEGIPVRIAPKSQIGMPVSWSPRGLGFGIGSFSVHVPAEYGDIAREIVREAEPRRATPSPTRRPYRSRYPLLMRVVATVVLLYLLIGMATYLAQLLPQMF